MRGEGRTAPTNILRRASDREREKAVSTNSLKVRPLENRTKQEKRLEEGAHFGSDLPGEALGSIAWKIRSVGIDLGKQR